MTDNAQAANRLALKTSGAYNANYFGQQEWAAAALMLLDRGYSEREAEAILRSKWTRWCRDQFSNAGEGKAEYLARFIDDPRNRCTAAAVAKLVEGTF